MPKELFDQTLIVTPDTPDDDDRLAFGQPSVLGAKNVKWSYFKELIQSAGITTFLGLTDTPSAFTGESLKAVRANAAETALEFYTPSSGSTTKIEDTATTTSVDTENATYADQIIINSANTGTDYIIQAFEGTGTPVPVFQVDGNGDLFNNGNFQVVTKNTNSVFLGTNSAHSSLTTPSACTAAGYNALNAISSGNNNTAFGYNALSEVSSASWNTAFGSGALSSNSGSQNTAVGYFAGEDNTGQSLNTYIGYQSGLTNRGSNNLFLGARGGYKQSATSNTLLMSSYGYADSATELTNSIIYGVMAAAPEDQRLHINAVTKAINLTTTEITALTGQSGDIVYNTSTNKLQCYNGSIWNDLF